MYAPNKMTASTSKEARGERAYDKIQATARNAPQSRTNTNNQFKPGPRPGPRGTPFLGISFSNPKPTRYNTNARQKGNVRGGKNENEGHSEENAIREAVSRSLADGKSSSSSSARLANLHEGENYEADLAEAKKNSMRDFSEVSNDHSSGGSSNRIRASSAQLPYAPLHSLLEDINVAAMTLEKRAREQRAVSSSQVAKKVRDWEGIVFTVLHSLGKAEDQRVKDINKRIDLDLEIEANSQKKLDKTNKMWEAKMATMIKEWDSKMESQKQMYEAKLADQNRPTKSAFSEEQMREQQTAAASQPQPAVASKEGDEIQALKATPLTAKIKIESKHAGEANFLKQKLTRVCNDNESLRKILDERDDSKEHDGAIKELKKMYEAQLTQLKHEGKHLVDSNAESKQEEQAYRQADQQSPASGSESSASFSKRKRNDTARHLTDSNAEQKKEEKHERADHSSSKPENARQSPATESNSSTSSGKRKREDGPLSIPEDAGPPKRAKSVRSLRPRK